MAHLLSKSKYIRGLQCDRALWLDVFNPRLARYTAEQMRRFDRGRDFEFAFKATFPDGIDLSAELKRNVDAYPARTAELLDKGDGVALFEAGFLYDDVLVLADVVQQREDGTLDIYEVKSGTALSETYRRDAALQHYVISHCREINTFSIVYANPDGGFIKEELSAALQEQHGEIEKNIAATPTSTTAPKASGRCRCLDKKKSPFLLGALYFYCSTHGFAWIDKDNPFRSCGLYVHVVSFS